MIPEKFKPKVIEHLWDRPNLNAINYNFDTFADFIAHIEDRLFNRTWEATKVVNTIEMLEPVQTVDDLPSHPQPKSLITVLENEKVYAYVEDEWQQFSEIDLDPFSPFKDELQTMINEHETKANQILSDTQTEHDKAVAKINDLTSDFNNNYQTKLDAFNQDYQTKSTQLKNDYQTYSSQIDTNTTNSLSDIDDAKNSALTKLDNFQNTDTSEWQKHKLTQDDGKTKALSDIDFSDTSQLDSLKTGFYYITTAENIPVGASSYNGFLAVYRRDTDEVKRIEFKPYDSTQTFIKRFYETWGEWEPADGTKIELFSGNIKDASEPVNLKDDPRNYSYLVIDLNHIGGDDTVTTTCVKDYIAIRTFNLVNSGNGATLIEMTMKIDSADATILNTDVHVRVETDTATGKEYMPKILRIVGVK